MICVDFNEMAKVHNLVNVLSDCVKVIFNFNCNEEHCLNIAIKVSVFCSKLLQNNVI